MLPSLLNECEFTCEPTVGMPFFYGLTLINVYRGGVHVMYGTIFIHLWWGPDHRVYIMAVFSRLGKLMYDGMVSTCRSSHFKVPKCMIHFLMAIQVSHLSVGLELGRTQRLFYNFNQRSVLICVLRFDLCFECILMNI